MTAPLRASTEPKCPDCGGWMKLRSSKKFPYPNGDPRRFWGCAAWPECEGMRAAHPDGTVYGIPGDRLTRTSRVMAHDNFDRWWKARRMTRTDAYTVLRRTMGLTEEQGHISMFNVEQCRRLVAIVAYEEGVTL